MEIGLKTYYNLKDSGSMKQAARQLAARGAKVEAVPVLENNVDRPGRMKVTGIELFIDDKSEGIVTGNHISEYDYIEEFVMLVEKLTSAPDGNSETTTGMTVLKRGKISDAIKIEMREASEAGMSIDELVAKYSRSKASIEKVLNTPAKV